MVALKDVVTIGNDLDASAIIILNYPTLDCSREFRFGVITSVLLQRLRTLCFNGISLLLLNWVRQLLLCISLVTEIVVTGMTVSQLVGLVVATKGSIVMQTIPAAVMTG